MEALLQQAASRQTIEGYGSGGFIISGVRHEGNVLVTLQSCIAADVPCFSKLTPECFASLSETLADVEVLLVGCGQTMQLLPSAIRDVLRSKGVATDVLDTGAACRTFNVLASEERRVAALLFAV